MSRDVCGICWCPIDNEGCGCAPKQPEALRLADELLDSMNDEHWSQLNADAAAELRRLHDENEALRYELDATERQVNILTDDLNKVYQAVKKLHAAKGRYHTQLAACDLFELVGLPNERPKK